MKGKRAYTIVIHDSSAAILRRFKITHRFLIGAIAGAVSLSTFGVVSGLALPFLGLAGWALYKKVDTLEVRNQELVEEKERLNIWADEAGDKLERFESDALKLSALAGIAGSPAGSAGRPAGGPLALPIHGTDGGEAPGKVTPGALSAPENDTPATTSYEVNEIRIRTEALDRRMDELEAAFLKRADRLDNYPLLRPANGGDGDGFAWRIDPFTGLRSFHEGLDILAPYGAPIVATGDGVIEQAGYATGYGLSVFIQHEHKIETRYGHMSRMSVEKGERVTKGQIIGYVGNSGRSSGAHLHYETLLDGQHVDPHRFLNSKSISWLARSAI